MKKDAFYWSQAIKSKEVSPIEVVDHFLAEIKKYNATYHAVTDLFEEEARQEAKQLKDFSAPFAGVPILIKEAGHDLEGKWSRYGSKLLNDHRASRTAYFTESLKQAGFIILGQTNVPEFALSFVSDSDLLGTVKNPVDPNYHAGGSSGGAAASVQLGMAPIASASDGGGSIRIPASYSGLVGLKVSRARTWSGPASLRSWAGASVNFALTQSVRDTSLLFDILALPDHHPLPYAAHPVKKEPSKDPKTLRLAFTFDVPSYTRLSPEAEKAVKHLLIFLQEEAFRMEEVHPDLDYDRILETYYIVNGVEQAKLINNLEQSMQRKINRQDMEEKTYLLTQYGQKIPAYSYSQAIDAWDQLGLKLENFHQAYDILIQATTMDHAPSIDSDLYNINHLSEIESYEDYSLEDLKSLVMDTFSAGHQASPHAYLNNLTGQPALSLPLHTCSNGLPLGLHFSAAKGREDVLLTLASYLEEHYGFETYSS